MKPTMKIKLKGRITKFEIPKMGATISSAPDPLPSMMVELQGQSPMGKAINAAINVQVPAELLKDLRLMQEIEVTVDFGE